MQNNEVTALEELTALQEKYNSLLAKYSELGNKRDSLLIRYCELLEERDALKKKYISASKDATTMSYMVIKLLNEKTNIEPITNIDQLLNLLKQYQNI